MKIFASRPTHRGLGIAAFTALLLFFLLFFQSAAQATAVFEISFGVGGKAVTNVGNLAQANAVIVQPDQKIIVAGSASFDNTGEDLILVRYGLTGALDAGFGVGGIVRIAFSNRNEGINAVALQPNGKIVAAGFIEASDGTTDFLVVRFNSDGSPDTTFGANGAVILNRGAFESFSSIAVQENGSIIAAGRIFNDKGAVFRLNPNGSLDSGFGIKGVAILDLPNYKNETISTVSLVAGGKLLLGGYADLIAEPPAPSSLANFLVLLDSQGAMAQNFGKQGIVSYGSFDVFPGFGSTIASDGKICTVSDRAYRFFSDGSTDYSFEGGSGGKNVIIRSDGKMLIFGNVFGLAAGIFNNGGSFVGEARLSARNVAIQPDDKIVVIDSEGGNFIVRRLLTITSSATRLADSNSDERTDIAVLRQSNSTLYVLNDDSGYRVYPSGEASLGVRRVIPESFGGAFSLPFVYWKAELLEGSPGQFVAVNDSGNRQTFNWGLSGDVPVGGDYDGDGFTDFTVFRPSDGVWYITTSSGSQFRAFKWGTAGDKPVPADYDADGITDFAVFRPSDGVWYVRRSSTGTVQAARFGAAGDVPLTGDFDGDGRADFVVYRPSDGTWYLLQTRAGFRAVRFGLAADFPVPGDYDGDGLHDIAVFRQGVWYILGSSRGFYAVNWGSPTDIPVAVRYAY